MSLWVCMSRFHSAESSRAESHSQEFGSVSGRSPAPGVTKGADTPTEITDYTMDHLNL